MEPTIAIAPTATDRDAVTNASTKAESPLLRVAYLSHSPNRSSCRSRSNTSPMSDPRASDPTTSAELTAASLPPSRDNMPAKAPESPTKRIATAVALSRVS